MKVTVTQDHINNGKPNSHLYCPIALAIKSIEGVLASAVSCTKASVISNDTYATLYTLPTEAQNFIHYFDRGWKVTPFEFEMKVGSW